MSRVRHRWMMLKVPILVLRHRWGKAVVSAPVWGRIWKHAFISNYHHYSNFQNIFNWLHYVKFAIKKLTLCIISLEGPALMAENAEVEAELLPSDGGSRAGLLNVSWATGLVGGCWIVCRWLSELEWDCWLSKSNSSFTMSGPGRKWQTWLRQMNILKIFDKEKESCVPEFERVSVDKSANTFTKTYQSV